MKKYAMAAAAAGFATLILFIGVRWAVHGRHIEMTDNAFIKADTVIVAPKISGRIATVVVADNAIVHEGDTLAVIEDEDYRAQLAQAEGEVAARAAALDAIRLRIDQAGAEIAGAAATVKSTEASLALQKIERERAAELARENFATKRALDQANAALKDWSGRAEGAAAGLDAAKASASIVEAQEKEAAAALKIAEARLDLARSNLDATRVRAPKSGVAGNLAARDGQYVNPGQRLVSIVPVTDVYVVANFKETQIGRIRPGARAKLEIDAYPGVEIEGEVESFAPASGAEFSLLPPENATGNFTKIVQRMPVRIKVTRAPASLALLPGLSVTVAVDTRGGEEGPPTALFAPRPDKGATRDEQSL
ncbi:MAG TPA: HlyD family secretion protein [Parvularculaceae bacterium]|nr:HlyD family secretion protein [Parvularculaceae bacterium]